MGSHSSSHSRKKEKKSKSIHKHSRSRSPKSHKRKSESHIKEARKPKRGVDLPKRDRPTLKTGFPQNRPLVNQFALAGILAENVKTNERLDRDEVSKANKNFKKIDNSNDVATLMSNHINTSNEFSTRHEYEMEFRDGVYIKVSKPFACEYKKCGQRFKYSTELTDHLNFHKQQEDEQNEKAAEEFTKKLLSNEFELKFHK